MPDLFHELAEALQAAETYLAVVRQTLPPSAASDDLENASRELKRAREAFHRLRVRAGANGGTSD